MTMALRKRFATTEEWVSAINPLAYKMDDQLADVHPSTCPENMASSYYQRLADEYRAVAAAQVDDQQEFSSELDHTER